MKHENLIPGAHTGGPAHPAPLPRRVRLRQVLVSAPRRTPRTTAARVARCCELETPIAASAGVGSSLRSTQPTRLSVHRPSS